MFFWAFFFFFSPYYLKAGLRISTAPGSYFCVLEAATCCECWESRKLEYRDLRKNTKHHNNPKLLAKTNAPVGSFAFCVENHSVLVKGAAEDSQSLHLSVRSV